jgi:hypothetical protein
MYSAVDVLREFFFADHLGPKVSFVNPLLADRLAIAELVEHVTVKCCSNQMVLGSGPDGRILACVRASSSGAGQRRLQCESTQLCEILLASHPAALVQRGT